MAVSLLSEHAADVLHELEVYVVRCGVAIDQRALKCLDELADVHRDYEAELDRLLGLHDEYLPVNREEL